MSVGAVFAGATLGTGDNVKSQQTFTEYYDGYGFFGGLTTLTTGAMYAVRLAAPSTLTVSGTPTQLPMAVTLASGWTWLPCPHPTSKSLADGMPVYSYSTSDHFKSQSAFAEFYEGYGWFGTQTTLDPGVGYKLRVGTGGTATFQSQRR